MDKPVEIKGMGFVDIKEQLKNFGVKVDAQLKANHLYMMGRLDPERYSHCYAYRPALRKWEFV